MADWMDGEVDIKEQTLTNWEIFALLRMTEALRKAGTAYSVGYVKQYIYEKNLWSAQECWDELSEEDQTALWVAPTFGGIFTTEERKIIKGGFEE